MSYRRSYLKAVLALPVLVVVGSLVAYFDRQMALICPSCGDSATYEVMQVLTYVGLGFPSLVLLWWAVDRALNKKNET